MIFDWLNTMLSDFLFSFCLGIFIGFAIALAILWRFVSSERLHRFTPGDSTWNNPKGINTIHVTMKGGGGSGCAFPDNIVFTCMKCNGKRDTLHPELSTCDCENPKFYEEK